MILIDLFKEMRQLIKEIQILIKELKALRKLIGLRQPGMVYLTMVSEENGMLRFKLALPPKSANDVINREVSVKIGEAEPQLISLGGDTTETELLECADGTAVTGSLVDIDDATPPNRSEPRTFEFIVNDTIAPPMPGALGIVLDSEV